MAYQNQVTKRYIIYPKSQFMKKFVYLLLILIIIIVSTTACTNDEGTADIDVITPVDSTSTLRL